MCSPKANSSGAMSAPNAEPGLRLPFMNTQREKFCFHLIPKYAQVRGWDRLTDRVAALDVKGLRKARRWQPSLPNTSGRDEAGKPLPQGTAEDWAGCVLPHISQDSVTEELKERIGIYWERGGNTHDDCCNYPTLTSWNCVLLKS
jgi:hypothetical protein